MSNCPLNVAKSMFFWRRLLAAAIFSSSLLIPFLRNQPAAAQLTEYCHLSPPQAQEKENLRLSALKGNQEEKVRYQQLLQQNAQALQECRNRNWPKLQAIWLRLYPCDVEPGLVDQIMDRIVNRGYNEVYL